MSSSVSTDHQWAGTAAVTAFLGSEPGRRAVVSAAVRHRLGTSLEDELAQMVQDEAMRMDQRGEPIRSAEGFVRHCLARRAVDLQRGQKRQRSRFGRRVEVDDSVADTVGEQGDPAVAELEFEQQLEALRAGILDRRLDAPAWQRSALLTYVAVHAERLIAGEGSIRPQGGTTPHHAALWTGLWYAGERACLAGDGGSAAVRQARSRKLRALGDLHARLRDLVAVDGA